MSRQPLISIVMPVYNSASYLKEAIESVLAQTYDQFELIIINDGSADKSRVIIESYTDPRITLINQENAGLSHALNRGVAAAKGEYIARMDGDDICHPDRLKKQLDYLLSNPDCGLLFSTVELIDEHNNAAGLWNEDVDHTSAAAIRSYLPHGNCLAHPTVLGKASIFKTLPYDARQYFSEDYDLWLRAISSGVVIAKLPEPLLRYRIHPQSFTQTNNATMNPYAKMALVQRLFVQHQLKDHHFGRVELVVSLGLAKYYGRVLLRLIPALPLRIYRFIKRRAHRTYITYRLRANAKSSNTRVAFLIPWMTVGGADKVYLDIIQSLDPARFTSYVLTTIPHPNPWKPKFSASSNLVIELPELVPTESYESYVTNLLREGKIDTLVISNCEAGYRILPGIKKILPSIRVVDIIHGQGGKNDQGGAPEYSASYTRYIDRRVAVSQYVKDYLVKTYRQQADDISVIYNAVDTSLFSPDIPSKQAWRQRLNIPLEAIVVTAIGRAWIEKRPSTLVEVAHRLKKQGRTDIVFIWAGDGGLKRLMERRVTQMDLSRQVFFVGDVEDTPELLRESDMLFMPSEMEGLGIAILEGMATGLPVVASNVGGIPELVEDGVNGHLVQADDIAGFTQAILSLADNKRLREKMGRQGRKKAVKKHSYELFGRLYSSLLKP